MNLLNMTKIDIDFYCNITCDFYYVTIFILIIRFLLYQYKTYTKYV